MKHNIQRIFAKFYRISFNKYGRYKQKKFENRQFQGAISP